LYFTASAKLGLQGNSCRVCLEDDGTVIDEDEVLAELKGQTLLILTDLQHWSPALVPSEQTATLQAQLVATQQAPKLPSDATDDDLNSSSQSVQEGHETDHSSSSGMIPTERPAYSCDYGKLHLSAYDS
jgi:CIDE-N domain